MEQIKQLRISEKNIVNDNIKKAEKAIQRSKDTISRYKQGTNAENFKTQIAALKITIDKNESILVELQARYNDINIGNLDEELLRKLIVNKEEIDAKNKLKKTRQVTINDENKTRKDASQAFYNFDSQYRRSQKYLEKDMARVEQYFHKINASIPDHILDKLSNMPNNKGYIWKDIHCYGALEADSDTVTMFDRKSKDLLLIHEWTGDEHIIYEKYGNGRKTLQSVKPRSIIDKKNKLKSFSILNKDVV